jgi:hypothetical protein
VSSSFCINVTELARRARVGVTTFHLRLKRGCTVDEALSTPRIQDGLTKSGTTNLEKRWLRGGR